MPSITALLYTYDDEARLGRCLETLYPCDHILVVDHGSRDRTLDIARAYAARIVNSTPGASPDSYLRFANPSWVLCLNPSESLSESLAASLYEWKLAASGAVSAFSVFLREETSAGWMDLPTAQTRLVPPDWKTWNGSLPADTASAILLNGPLQRFAFP